MTDEQLMPITEAAAELADIGAALDAQDTAWFKGNQSLGAYYKGLSQRLAELRATLKLQDAPQTP